MKKKGCVGAWPFAKKLPGATRLATLLSCHPRYGLFSVFRGNVRIVVRFRFRVPNPRTPRHHTPELPEAARRHAHDTHWRQEPIPPIPVTVANETPSGRMGNV